jgi:DNA-binding response OmpR family regulator
VKRVLIVEDNADLAFGLRNNLELEGYAVQVAADGRAALQVFREAGADLVVLDLMLPEMDGFEVLKALRQVDTQVPILILTARGEEVDKVTGLRLGADDYVTKPFGLLELLARVEALLRRTMPDTRLRFGAVEVDLATRTVTRAGAVVDLSPREIDLLVALLRHGGAVVSRQKLLDEVWGYAADVLSRTVDTHVAELRRKLELDPAHPQHIVTVRKAGYRLVR